MYLFNAIKEVLSMDWSPTCNQILLDPDDLIDMLARHGWPGATRRQLRQELFDAGYYPIGWFQIDGRRRRFWSKNIGYLRGYGPNKKIRITPDNGYGLRPNVREVARGKAHQAEWAEVLGDHGQRSPDYMLT